MTIFCPFIYHDGGKSCETCACDVVRPAVYDGPVCVDCGGPTSNSRHLRCNPCGQYERHREWREARLRSAKKAS